MADVVLCYSILELCMQVDAFSSEIDAVQMVLRLRQHRAVVSEALMDFYEAYFREKGPGFLQWYQDIWAGRAYSNELAVMNECEIHKKYVQNQPYYNELIALAVNTAEKIILMEPRNKIQKYMKKEWGISAFGKADILDDRGTNGFSMLTLPVHGKRVEEGESSTAIAKWIGYFLAKENYIQIFDNYLLTGEGIRQFKKYFLKYIKEGTDIEIFSMEDSSFPEQQIKSEFSKPEYQKWNFSIYLVKDKKGWHARAIQGSKYIIQVERGISVFGRNGETFQTLVNIFENNVSSRIAVTESHLKQVL